MLKYNNYHKLIFRIFIIEFFLNSTNIKTSSNYTYNNNISIINNDIETLIHLIKYDEIIIPQYIAYNFSKIYSINSNDTYNIITNKIEELISNLVISNTNEKENNVIKVEENADMYQIIITDNQNNNTSQSDNKIDILSIIESEFTEGNFNELISNVIEKKEKDIIIQQHSIIIQFTTLDNQKKIQNQKNNISSINLGECETKLKLYYLKLRPNPPSRHRFYIFI